MKPASRRLKIAAITVAATVAGAAQAAVVSNSFEFTASGFTGFSPPPPPLSSITGTIAYTFDNDAGFTERTDGLTVDITDAVETLGPGMFYNKLFDILQIGDRLKTVSALGPGTADWFVSILGVSSANPTIGFFYYTQPGTTGPYFTSGTGVRVTPVPAPVPEPASLALLAFGGLGLIGATRIRRRA